jgi:hypothetical protein
VVWACLLEKPLEVVHRRPRLTLVAACSGRGMSHARVTCLTVVDVSRSRDPLRVLLVPLFATFDALLGAVSGEVVQRFPVTMWGPLPASLGGAKHDHLVAGGAWGGDAVRLLKRVPEEVATSALPQALRGARTMHPCYPGKLGACRADHAAIAETGMRSLMGVMVPFLSWMASQWASTDQSWHELGWELRQTNANEHTRLAAWRRWRESLPVGGTSCPPHWW